MTETTIVPCPFCESGIGADAKKCRYCGEWVARNCDACGTPVRGEWAARGLCAPCQVAQRQSAYPQPVPWVAGGPVMRDPKSRGAAIALALLGGGLGFHKFYLGSPGWGIVYLLFFWTFLPTLAGLVEGVNYALMGEENFHRRYSVRA